MPRGAKICSHCNTVNGPRAFFCKNEDCKKPFVIKGVVTSEEKRVELENKKLNIKIDSESESPNLEYFEISDFFVKDQPLPHEVKNFGRSVTCYSSKDGNFRLRYSEEFMGVNIDKLHGKRYSLLKKNEDSKSTVDWNLVRRFSKMQNLLRFFNDVNLGNRQLVMYKPGDDDRRSHRERRVAKRNKKMKGKK